MISRVVLSLGAVAASLGLLLYGMGTSYSPKDDGLMQFGIILLIAGSIATLAGIVMYRASEKTLEEAARAKYGPEQK